MNTHNSPSEFEPEILQPSISDTHRVTLDFDEVLQGNKHLIITEHQGYVADDGLEERLLALGLILPGRETHEAEYEYEANGLTSLRGFLNSTKVDARGSEKRARVVEKISNSIDGLSHEQIVVTLDRDATYNDFALDSSSSPVLLPVGFRFSIVESHFEADTRNSVIGMQVASSILAVLGNADDTPFKGLVR
jgi:hypothetical protein